MVAFAERTSPVDLVVTDLVMPGLNGRALVEQLRVHEPDLAVLYVSGHAEKLVGDMQSHIGDAPISSPSRFTPTQLGPGPCTGAGRARPRAEEEQQHAARRHTARRLDAGHTGRFPGASGTFPD